MSEEDNIPNLLYNYPETTINLNQYEHSFSTSGYIKIPYVNAKSIIEPNLIYKTQKYKTTNLYIFKKKYNLDTSKDYDAECIIEHVSTTNPDKKVYVCILLVTMKHNSERNQIDELISQSDRQSKMVALKPTLSLNLNNLLVTNKERHKILADIQGSVFIFREPIYIGTDFAQINGGGFIELFSYDRATMKEITASPIENMKYKEQKSEEGFTNIFSSFPTEVEGLKTMKEVYMKPNEVMKWVESKYGKPGEENRRWNETNRLLSQITSVVCIFIIFIITFFTIPSIYKFLIVDLVNTALTNSPSRLGSINSLSIFVLLILLGMGFHILFQPNNSNKIESQIFGLYIIVWSSIIAFVVFIYKRIDPSKYGSTTETSTGTTSFNFNIFSEIIMYYVGLFKQSPITVISIIVGYYLLVGLLIGLLTKGGKRDLLLTIFTVYIVPLLLLFVYKFGRVAVKQS
jgi:hypothetical protein